MEKEDTETQPKNKLYYNLSDLRWLDILAIFVVFTTIVIMFGSFIKLNFINNTKETQESKHIVFNLPNIEQQLSKDELITLNDSLQVNISKLNTLSNELSTIQRNLKEEENKFREDMRFYLTILGSVFAIVGFFGIKSIFDTRQAAVEKAITEAKESAEKTAEKTAEKIAEEIAKEIAKKTAKDLIPNLTNTYLNREIPEELKRLENSVTTQLENCKSSAKSEQLMY